MSEELFHQNLTLWSHSHPRESIWLQYVDTDHLQLQKSDSGQWNLLYQNGEYSFTYHSQEDPVKEAKTRFSNLKLEGIKVLFIYGVGLGYDFLAAKKWLEKDKSHYLVFIEDDLAVVARLFETELGREIINHYQVQLTFFQGEEHQKAVFNELFWHYFGMPFQIVCSVAYQKYKQVLFEGVKHELIFDFETKNDLLQEYLGFGAAFFRNFYLNVQKLDQAYLGNSLFGKFKDVPAIICGAGPSLHKNMNRLKKVKNKALIIAGSSALNALSQGGVQPHFGVGIDPNSMQAGRFSELPTLDFPFFYRQRLFPKALNQITGPRLYITGTGGYEIADWFERHLGIEGESVEEGRNVVNFSLELAHMLGCNPIIIVGTDLGYTDLKLYSPGVITGASPWEKQDIIPEELGDDVLLKKDIYGKPLYTLWKWVSESKWISDFAKEHPGLTVINATEGGLGFEGVPNLTFQEVCERHLIKSYRLPSRIQKLIKGAEMPQVTQEKILELMDLIKKGLKKCLHDLQILTEENEKVRQYIQKTGDVDQTQTGKAILVETELAEEEAFQAVLEIFNSVYTRVLDREIKELSDPARHLPEKNKALKKLALNDKKYTFLSQVTEVNLKLLEFALENKDLGTVKK